MNPHLEIIVVNVRFAPWWLAGGSTSGINFRLAVRVCTFLQGTVPGLKTCMFVLLRFMLELDCKLFLDLEMHISQ